MRYLILIFLLSPIALSQPTLQSYVFDATISGMQLSPNGEIIAFTKKIGDQKALIVMTTGGEVISRIGVGDDKLRGYEFAGNNHIIMYKSLTRRFLGYTGEYEFFGAISLNFRTNKSKQLLTRNKHLLYPQLRLDIVLGPASKEDHVLMAARSGKNQESWTFDVYRVNLDSGSAKRLHIGKQKTIDWFIDDDEVVYAREEFNNRKDVHEVLVKRGKKWEPIFRNEAEILEHSFVGLTEDKTALAVIDTPPNSDFDALYHYSLSEGTKSSPIFHNKDREIDTVIKGWNQQIIGVRYSGLTPSYQFYDKQLTADIDALVQEINDSSLNVLQLSRDLSKVLLLVEGGGSQGMYLLFDRNQKKVIPLATKRPEIPPEYVSVPQAINITARDGQVIPTLVTLPSTVSNPKNRPAIVLPHGGPEQYDQIGFDYQAQYFASRGYVVIQPNFRGSTGFGHSHKLRGRGRWGKEMQTDLSDALEYTVNQGWVDKSKVCIVGASYGGYAALAGGAFTPELYRCVVAVAPVSDLPKMLTQEIRDAGKDHWVVAYWNRVIGDRKADREKLKEVSPAYHPDNFTAPVLLIHGDDDTVVPISQSKLMHKKLKSAKKPVEFIKLKKEDHWMSTEETRLQAMEAIARFVSKYLD